jgi:hypothetical protein
MVAEINDLSDVSNYPISKLASLGALPAVMV